MTQVTITPRVTGAAILLAIHGELDLANAHIFPTEVSDGVPETAEAVVLDLSELRFIDSAGVGALFHLAELQRRADRQFAIVLPPSSSLQQLFKITQLHEVVSIYEDEQAALNGLTLRSG